MVNKTDPTLSPDEVAEAMPPGRHLHQVYPPIPGSDEVMGDQATGGELSYQAALRHYHRRVEYQSRAYELRLNLMVSLFVTVAFSFSFAAFVLLNLSVPQGEVARLVILGGLIIPGLVALSGIFALYFQKR